MFFDDWSGLLRVLVVGVCAYLALLAMVRGSGKRALAKLNAFDFVVTVVLGSTLATVLLSSDVALTEGVLALALLVALQSLRSRAVERLVKSEPALVYRHGFLQGPMRRMRIAGEEIRQAPRAAGSAGLEKVTAVLLETDGSLSVLPDVPERIGPEDAEERRRAGA